MARVLLAWELGHGYGHVYPLRALALELQQQGHQVLLVGRSLLRVRSAFVDPRIRLLAAPFFPGVILPSKQMSTLADVIWFDAGGHSPEVMQAVFRAWRELLLQLRVDLLIADAAPLALAAAQGVCSSLSYGGYFHATDARGWGIFRDWERIDRRACELRSQQLLSHLNLARASVGLGPAADLAAGFGADARVIRFLPELDYAGPRPDVSYVGVSSGGGAEPCWPQAGNRRLFAYVRKDYSQLDRLLAAFARLEDCSVLCFHDGLPPAKMPQAPHLVFSSEPWDIRAVLKQADAIVCHGGSLQALAVRAGKPLLSLPLQAEQFLCARMAVQLGVGLMHLESDPQGRLLQLLRQALADEDLAMRAHAFAAQVRGRDPDGVPTVAALAAHLLSATERKR